MASLRFRRVSTAREPASPQESFLVFRLGREEFATPAGIVRQLIASPQIVSLPTPHPILLGLIHAGGRAAPLLDLRARLGRGSGMHGSALVAELPSATGTYCVSVLVDKFCGPASIATSGIAPGSPPIAGIARTRGKTRFVLDLAALFPPDEVRRIEALMAPVPAQ
jgi:purine-binding chemotaxis protein CheW